ncbi:DUF3093 domain-containing protein [Corynebacterium testudinoris]|uniref:DUF3093 domain-containing protein n=1 Tax=Corynebacterium testudinoris TaxID=136857 RepID=UPI0006413AD9|nr:DUF3093 domain-containing protein [Corynebacterium testudinoris]MBX8995360.1 DUF3093 domain-containing protein [Corynebacterium testudinoris]
MSDTSSSPETAPETAQKQAPRVLYRERQWVPAYWWVLAALLAALTTAQLANNRNIWWLIVPAIVLSAVAVWVLTTWSSTVLTVEEDPDGTRWLTVRSASLPSDVVSRSLAVPATAKRNAMGRQLDPAAFVVSHGWVHEMVMLVLDDPEDPTPYWLISTRNPEAVLTAFLPEQTDTSLAHYRSES